MTERAEADRLLFLVMPITVCCLIATFTRSISAAELNVKDFGAVADGRTDDSAAIQAALNTLGNNAPHGTRGGRLRIPGGEYLINKTITMHRMSVIVVGDGFGNSPMYSSSPGGATVLRWNGAPETPIFRVTDSRGVFFEQLRFEGRVGVEGTSAINFFSILNAGQGTNEHLVVQDCYFGRYPWTVQGTHKGDLAFGVLFDGDNTNNDEFRIVRSVFSNCATGVAIKNTQSIWGSLTDCVFDKCSPGVATAAGIALFNPQFNRCNPDVAINAGRMQIVAWQSEHSAKLATVGVNAGLTAQGGTCQLGDIAEAMIDAFPSGTGQAIALRDIEYIQNRKNPPIRFGPKSGNSTSAAPGFSLIVNNCTGLSSSQCAFVGSIWASKPESVGVVDWFTQSRDGITQFKNIMRRQPESARYLDTSRRD